MKDIPVRNIRSEQLTETSESFSIRDVRQILNGKSMMQDLHRHDHYFLLVLKKGKGKHSIDLTEYTVCDNSVFFLRPGQVHKLTLYPGCSGNLLQFGREFYSAGKSSAKQVFRSAGLRNFCRPDKPHADKIFRLLELISAEYLKKETGYSDVIKSYLEIFFIELLRSRHKGNSKPAKDSAYLQEKFEELCEHLETNIRSLKQVSDYAKLMNMSVYQLNSITRSVLGKTCSGLIDEQIILEAKRNLLANTDQVNQIALHLGFEDISYFIRFFKKHTGFTPGAFREKFK